MHRRNDECDCTHRKTTPNRSFALVRKKHGVSMENNRSRTQTTGGRDCKQSHTICGLWMPVLTLNTMSDVLFISLKGKSSWVCRHQKFVCRRIYARMKESFSRFSSSSSCAVFLSFSFLSLIFHVIYWSLREQGALV